MRHLYFLGIIAWFLCGCADSPSGPSPTTSTTTTAPSATTFNILSGETHEAVPGASFTLAGHEYETDQSGQVTIQGHIALDAYIDIDAPGYLHRQTLFRSPNGFGLALSSDERLLTLWPKTSPTGLTEAFTREMLYTCFRGGECHLIRPSPSFSGATIIPDAVLRSDASAMRTIEQAADSMTVATDRRYVIRTVLHDGMSDRMPIRLVVDPQHSTFKKPGYEDVVAFCDNEFDSYIITSSMIVFKDIEYAKGTITLHELGHTLGLFHTSSYRDVMCGLVRPWAGRANEFTPRERLLINLMLTRRPGNLFPDNDRWAQTQWSARGQGASGHYIVF